MTSIRPSRRDLIRWAAATSLLSGCGVSMQVVPPWKPAFLTADEVDTLGALADTLMPPEADASGGGKALGVAVFVDRLLSALDGAPALHAEGPYSGRQPFDDGKGGVSKKFPDDAFTTFAPLDRVNAEAWRLKLFGGTTANETVTGLRADVRGMLAKAKETGTSLAGFQKLNEDQRDLCLELVCQAAFSASEYGGNAGQAGWKAIHFDGDSQPLGYSLWDADANQYRERPDFPMSTANPGTDPDPLDATTKELIEKVVGALGGRIAS